MKIPRQSAAALTLAALCAALLLPGSAQASFGIVPGSFAVTAKNQDGSVDFQAGSHPYEYTVSLAMNQDGSDKVEGNLAQLVVELPRGLVGDPQALPVCLRGDFDTGGLHLTCPGDTQIGVADLEVEGLPLRGIPLYNLTPSPGSPGTIGFAINNNNSFQEASLRSDSDYGLTASDLTIPTGLEIDSIKETIWGVPADPAHDPQRICLNAGAGAPVITGCESDAPLAPFLTLPPSCTGPLATTLRVYSLQEPGAPREETVLSRDEAEEPAGLDGCNALEFDPSISAQPTTNRADSPSGLEFDLHQPQPPAVEVGAGGIARCGVGAWATGGVAFLEFAYRWLREGQPIAGAEAADYPLGAADAGSELQCEVIATNPGGQQQAPAEGPGHALSAPLAIPPHPATPPPVPGTPTISLDNEPALAEAATCNPGAWSGASSFAYRWFRQGAELPGQTEATYSFPPGPGFFTLQCEAIGTSAGGAVAALSANNGNLPGQFHTPIPDIAQAPRLYLSGEPPLATAPAKDVTVTLPAGMALNPAAANGLGACSEQEIGYAPKEGQAHFSKAPQSCPDAAKIGTLEVLSPLLGEFDAKGKPAGPRKLQGAVYVAAPFQNPFGSLLAIYLAVEDPRTGIVAKLAGKVTPDPVTGQLTTTVAENPELPLEDVALHLFEGARAALRAPIACGSHTTTSTLTPWSTPEGADAHPSDSFQTTQPAGGSGSCPANEGSAPNSPAFSAGTVAPAAGAYSPFVLKLTRPDGSQQLTGIDTTLPPGLTGKLAGIATCSDAQLAVAKSREAPNKGVLEQQSPSCPASSEVGAVTVGAGAGPTPFYATGHAYLAGPYKGAPLSLAVITPAVAGPFDLGDVVVRAALYLNPETAQIHAVSDPIPSIIDGVPLDVRSIALSLARQQFTLNPTSCNPMSIAGSASTLPGQSAALSSPFQVGGCSALPYQPTLTTRLTGPTKRGKFPALTATIKAKPGEANSSRVAVTLPRSEFLEQGHFGTICTRVQFAAKACPAKSVYGSVKVITPLLGYPLEGPVYLRSSSHNLPDLVLALRGPASQPIEVTLDGRIDSVHRGIRTSFEALPDAPFSEATLSMPGGKKGLLVNSTNVCAQVNRSNVQMDGQNGKAHDFKAVLVNAKCKQSSKKKGGKR